MKQPAANSAAAAPFDKLRAAPTKQEDVWVPSVCDSCRSFCGIRAHRVNGVVVKLEGDPKNPANMGKMCAKGRADLMAMYDPSRLTTPLKRTNPENGLGCRPLLSMFFAGSGPALSALRMRTDVSLGEPVEGSKDCAQSWVRAGKNEEKREAYYEGDRHYRQSP